MTDRLQILAAAFLFGTTGTAQAIATAGSAISVGSGRIVLGGAALWLVARLLRSRDRRPARMPRAPLLIGAVCVAAYQLTFFAAVAATGVAVGTVVAIGSAPALAGLIAHMATGERLDGRWAAATALAAAGVVVLTLGGAGGGEVSAAGIGLALCAGAGYAAYTVCSKQMLDAGARPLDVMGAMFGTAALLLVPVLAMADFGWVAQPDGAALALYLALVPTAIAYVLFARGLARVSASETATLSLAEPLTAAMLGVALLGERPSALSATGAALVLCGIAALALRSPVRRPVLAPA